MANEYYTGYQEEGAFVEVKPCNATKEAQYWASKLAIMYMEWAGREGYDVQQKDLRAEGEGISYASFRIVGEGVLVRLKNETGDHRCVYNSPFDEQHRRTTVWVFVRVFEEKPVEREGWHEVRTYVLDPYKMVKDYRKDIEVDDVWGVLAGDLSKFVN